MMARTPIHPGEILAGELEEIGLTAKKLADILEVPPNRLYQILAGKRNMTADTSCASRSILACRLSSG
ncbi:MAG: hypothetical protein R2762_06600 [Bryobacteraceae bacterium]